VTLFGLLMLAVLFTVAAAAGFILFGTGDGSSVHLAYVNGKVIEQSMLLHLIKLFLLSSIDVLMVMTLAFMISSVFRNSSLAIGISIFLLLTGGNVTSLLASRYEWAKYILFANTNLMQYFDGVPMVEGMTLGFSVIMLIIYFIIFQLLAFWVFTKRDINA
jgi:ABC-2 type transport system permease protein